VRRAALDRRGVLARAHAPMLSAPTDPGVGIPAMPGSKIRDLPFSSGF